MIFVVRLDFSYDDCFDEDDITARENRVNANPAIICIVVLTLEFINGLHSGSGLEASADHCRYKMYETTIDEVSTLASSLVLKSTMTYKNTLAIKVIVIIVVFDEQCEYHIY